MIKEIKYIGFYNTPSPSNARVGSLAAMNKMDYIGDTLCKLGYIVHMVSPSWIINKGLESQHTFFLSKTKKLTVCPSAGSSSKLRNYFSIVLSLSWLLFWLLLKVKKNEKIIV